MAYGPYSREEKNSPKPDIQTLAIKYLLQEIKVESYEIWQHVC